MKIKRIKERSWFTFLVIMFGLFVGRGFGNQDLGVAAGILLAVIVHIADEFLQKFAEIEARVSEIATYVSGEY